MSKDAPAADRIRAGRERLADLLDEKLAERTAFERLLMESQDAIFWASWVDGVLSITKANPKGVELLGDAPLPRPVEPHIPEPWLAQHRAAAARDRKVPAIPPYLGVWHEDYEALDASGRRVPIRMLPLKLSGNGDSPRYIVMMRAR